MRGRNCRRSMEEGTDAAHKTHPGLPGLQLTWAKLLLPPILAMQNRQSRQTQIIIHFTKRMKIVERGVQNSSAKTIIRTHLAALVPPPSPGPRTECPPSPRTEPWAPDLRQSQRPPVARVLRILTQFERPPLWGSMPMAKSRGTNTTVGEKARANSAHQQFQHKHGPRPGAPGSGF